MLGGAKRRISIAIGLVLCALSTMNAATITNIDQTRRLNSKNAWSPKKVPGAGDIALWTANSTASVLMGANLTWQGISITASSGVTLNITGGQLLTLGSSGIDLSGSAIDLTLAVRVALSADQTWNVASGRTVTVSGVVSGNRNLTKNGLGTVILSGANTFQGTTTINAGTISINSASSLGTSTTPIIINPTGILQATATFSSSRGITLGGTGGASSGGTLDVTGANVETRSGAITGTGSLTKTGTGTLALNGTNSYTGGTYVLGGTITSDNTSAFGPQPTLGSSLYGVHLSGGTTLQAAFSYVSNRQFEFVSGTATVSITQGNVLQNNGLLYGSGGLIKSGPGTEIVTNANTYSGGTTINGGTLQVNNSSGSGTGSGSVVVNSGGNLSGLPTATGFANPGTISGAVTVNSGGAITARSGGTFTFGGLTLNSGAASNFQIGAPTGTSIINLTGINNLSLAGPSTVNITNAGGLAGGTYTLFNYSGTALGSIANLSLGSTPGGGFDYTLVNNTANTSIDLLVSPTSKQWAPDASGNWSVTTNWTDSVVPNAAGAQANFFSHITSPQTVTVNGTFTVGSITFNNANSYTVASGGLILNNNGTAVIAAQQGAHTISAALTLANDLQLNSSAGSSVTISGVLSESGGSRAVTLTGPGTVTFSGATANTYTGLTTVSAGTLNLNKTAGVNAIGTGNLEVDPNGTVALLASNQIPDTAIVLNDGTFALGSSSETIAALNGTGTVTTASGSILTIGASNNLDSEFDGTISGGGTLTKAGTGTLTLAGTNTFGGAGQTINVNAGTLSVASDTNLGNASNTLTFNGGSLLTTDVFTSSRNLIMTSSATITNLDDATLNGVISGNQALTKNGPGTMFLNGTNTYTGGTTINAGTVVINNATNLGNGGTLTIGEGALEVATGFTTSRNIALTASSSTINVDAGQNYNTSGTISGAGSLNKEGNGTLTLSGTTTYTGDTIINGGTLTALGANNALASSPNIIVNTGGTLLLGGTNQISSTPPIFLDGGTIAKGNFSEGAAGTVGLGALTLTSDSIIDFGTGTVGVLSFASFTPDSNILTINNWTGVNGAVGTGSTDRLIFNSDQAANLAFFNFTGYSGGAIEFNLGGGFFEVVPVPEPSTWIGGSLALGVLGFHFVRRRQGKNKDAGIHSSAMRTIRPVVAAALFHPALSAQATDIHWNGSVDSKWRENQNWAPGGQPGINDNAVFDALFFPNQPNLTFNDNCGGLWMTGAIVQNVTISSDSDTLTLQGNTINGTAGLGILVDNTNGSKLTITTDLRLGGNQTWLNTSSNVLNILGGVNLNDKALTIDGTGNLELDGVISNSGIVPNNDTVTLTGTGTRAFTGANTYTGLTSINGGTLIIENDTGLGDTTSGTTVASGAQLQLVGASTDLTIGNEALTLNGSGIGGAGPLDEGALRSVTGNNSFAGVITLGSDSTIISGQNTLTLSGGIVNGGFTATLGGAGDIVASGVISGTGGLIKNGSGTLIFSGGQNNTYSGATFVNDGEIEINKSGGRAGLAGDITIGDGIGAPNSAILRDLQTAGGAEANDPTITINSDGLLDLNGDSETAGPLIMTGGNITTGAGTLTMAGDVTTNAASASAVISGKVALGTDRIFTVADGAASQDLVISAVISGTNDNLTKNGAGTLVLSGINTYTGATIINAGTLIAAAGSGAALGKTSGITVNSGGTLLLGANDEIKNSVPLTLAGGTFNKGDFSEGTDATQGIGKLTLTAAGSHLDFGTGIVGVLSFDSFDPNTFILIIDNWTGTANTVGTGSTDRLIFDLNQTANLASFAFTGYEPGAVQIDLGGGFFEVVPLTPVPEPPTWIGASLAFGVLGLTLLRRSQIRLALPGLHIAGSATPILAVCVLLFFSGCTRRNSVSIAAKVLAVEQRSDSRTTNGSAPLLQSGQLFSSGETFRLGPGQEVTMAFTPGVLVQLLDEAGIVVTRLRLGRDGNETGHEIMDREIEIRCLNGSIIGSVPADALKTQFIINTEAGTVTVEPGSVFYVSVSDSALRITCPRGSVRFTAANSADVIVVPPGKWLVHQKGATTRPEPQAAFEDARAQQELTLALEAEVNMQPLLAAEQRAVPSWRHL